MHWARRYEVRYVPHGLTIAIFLGESHIVLTTWPEFNLLLVDILLCNPQMDPREVVEQIRQRILPGGTHGGARDAAPDRRAGVR